MASRSTRVSLKMNFCRRKVKKDEEEKNKKTEVASTQPEGVPAIAFLWGRTTRHSGAGTVPNFVPTPGLAGVTRESGTLADSRTNTSVRLLQLQPANMH
jgi:hypothetical protein